MADALYPKLPHSTPAFNESAALLRLRHDGRTSVRPAAGAFRAIGRWALGLLVTLGMAHSAWADALLEPDQAFRPAVRLVPGGFTIAYEVTPGYYLYRDRIRIATVPPLPLGDLELPVGEAIDDPFVGPTRIFRRSVAILQPLTASPRPGAYRVRITAQGCAEGRFCYRPFVQEALVEVPAR